MRRGGRCELCEESYPPEVLDFHHPDPTNKETNLSVKWWRGVRQQAQTEAEADRCHMLCANCHRMEHIALKQGRSLLKLKETNHG